MKQPSQSLVNSILVKVLRHPINFPLPHAYLVKKTLQGNRAGASLEMCRGLARIVVVLTDRHSTFAEEKAMTKGKEERGRWSNYRRGTALLAPCLSSILLPITRSGEAKTKANR